MFSIISGASIAASLNDGNHLFFIERSKNKNRVQYDVCLTEKGDISDSNPVAVYWVLENGRLRELNPIEKRYAYGINSHEKLEKNKLKLLLAALKDREIVVEKLEGSFKAIVAINGKVSILERVYVETKERLTGLPKVLYLDLLGRTKEAGIPIKERVLPK